MRPALPKDVSSAAPRRSTSATARPRFCKCSATQIPTMPAPRTTTSHCMLLLVIARSGATKQSRGARASILQRELLERVAIRARLAAAHRERPRDFAHVEIVLRIEGETVGRGEASRVRCLRRAPASEDFAIAVEDAHARVTLF